MLSTMSLDSLFLSLLISRPAAEKICSGCMDVEGHTWQSLRFKSILIHFSYTNLKDRSHGWSLLSCDQTSKLFVFLWRGKYHCILKTCE